MTTLHPPYPLIHLESVDSTNIYAGRMLLEKDVDEGTVILADYQEKGKGQGISQWVSSAGSNLLFSMILKPTFLPVEKQFYLSMCISNALAAFTSEKTGQAHIKWPNDILVKGRKIAGILIENTVMGENIKTSVIGIGFNVNQTSFPADIPAPVSLKLLTGSDYVIADQLTIVLDFITAEVNKLYTGRLDIIRTAYLNNLAMLNQWSQYTDSSGTFEGRITDIADSGELLVMNRSGKIMKYGFKEIAF
jgi:BirA family biotin operon repressor/biotin-[acetyl-CoA-carboxylase] ligase